jgi:hypothetical protein
MSTQWKGIVSVVAVAAVIVGLGALVFASDYYEVESDSELVGAYGLEDERLPDVEVDDVPIHNPGRIVDDGVVTERLSDDVYVVEVDVPRRSIEPRVLVVEMDGDATERILAIDREPAVGDQVDLYGRVASLDTRQLAEHVPSKVIAGANLPGTVVYADRVEVESR